MGHVLESTKEMGHFNVEVRSDSFYLSSELKDKMTLSPSDFHDGTIEFNLEDISKLRACLDTIEEYINNK